VGEELQTNVLVKWPSELYSFRKDVNCFNICQTFFTITYNKFISSVTVTPYSCRPRHRRRILVRVRTFECTTSYTSQQLRNTTDRNHGEKVLEIKNYSNKTALILRANTMRRNIQNLNIITTARLG
jgi:hypothetical protein